MSTSSSGPSPQNHNGSDTYDNNSPNSDGSAASIITSTTGTNPASSSWSTQPGYSFTTTTTLLQQQQQQRMQPSASRAPPPHSSDSSSAATAAGQQSHPQQPAAAAAAPAPPPPPQAKRTRVLLSCGPCRFSKLRCDRATPCGQCTKKGRAADCVYAPRPQRPKPPRSVAARLRRLEGMVREMMEEGEGTGEERGTEGDAEEEERRSSDQATTTTTTTPGGVVVQGGSSRVMNFVGGTHCMAILEDIEDLKNYFDDPPEEDQEMEEEYEGVYPGPSELLLFVKGTPKSREELLSLLPDKSVIDRLINRYFNSNSPSQYIMHIPTFTKEYNEFMRDPDGKSLHWIASLFMVLALGVYLSSFQAPHELAGDGPMSAMARYKYYRGAAGWALLRGKYSQPGPHTLVAMLLFVEGEFMSNHVTQMNSYLLSSTLLRLMLKMGLHRDPSKLPNITAYQGEMRRRVWHLAIQVDLLIAFHLGLPAMIHGIESDTDLPRNLLDSDFNEHSQELPPARPDSDYTSMTYATNKSRIARVFAVVAKQAHALTPPTYAEVMKVDDKLGEVWDSVPQIMKIKPLDQCIMDPPMQVIQRFGLAALYRKSLCVLHRRYLSELPPHKEHAYSRRACIEAALALLDQQFAMSEASRPGNILSQQGWFVSSFAVNDFLLSNMIVLLVVQNENYAEAGGIFDWVSQGPPLPSKEELIQRLRTSDAIWRQMPQEMFDVKKAAEVFGTMLRRMYAQRGIETEDIRYLAGECSGSTTSRTAGNGQASSIAGLRISDSDRSAVPGGPQPMLDFTGFGMVDPSKDAMDEQMENNPSWGVQNQYDWNNFEAMTREPMDAIVPAAAQTQVTLEQAWLDRSVNEFEDFLASSGNIWDHNLNIGAYQG